MYKKGREKYDMPDKNPGQLDEQETVKSLEELLYERALTEDEVLDLMIDLCRELEIWERKKTVYGAIQPDHILLTVEGRAKLQDPGVSSEGSDHAGTYMAPEAFRGEPCDTRADLYALGLMFYRIMNRGREPFVSLEKQIVGHKDRQEALKKRMGGERLPLPADASPALARILRKVCAFRPEERYRTASGLCRALKKCRRARTDRFRQFIGGWSTGKRIAAVFVCMAVLGICGFGIWQQMLFREHTNQETGDYWSISRNGTLTLKGEGAYSDLCAEPDWISWTTWIRKIVVCGEVKNLYGTFASCVSLESVELQEGLETIGPQSFHKIETLREVSFPSTLKEIEFDAFCGCSSLKRVVFPEGLETIGDMAFASCGSLEQIEFPPSVIHFGMDVFLNTPWLETQRTKGDFLVVNGTLIEYFGDREEVEITEDLGILRITSSAFGTKKEIRSLILADTVEELGTGTFSSCKELTSVRLSAGLKELPANLFQNCESLEEIVIPEGVEKIGRYAFRDASNLKYISIPDTVTCIEEEVFNGTMWYEALMEGNDYTVWNGFLLECLIDEEEIVIPEELGIRRIADYAFAHKKKLKKAVIPEGVISIGEGCFFFCENLETIEFPESLKEFGRGPMAATKWMKDRAGEGGPVLVNGIDVSY